MSIRRWIMALVPLALAPSAAVAGDAPRPPATPLVTHHPYFSAWLMADRLTDAWPRHWTGSAQALCGLARVDGKAVRWMGMAPDDVPALKQTGLVVTPTRSTFTFEGEGVRLDVSFTSPLIPHDLDIVARPVTYLTWSARSIDGKPHDVKLYLDASGEWAVDKPDQKVTWGRDSFGPVEALNIGMAEPKVLARSGDNLRIEWGRFHLAAPRGEGVRTAIHDDLTSRFGFARDGSLPPGDDDRKPRAANDSWPVLALTIDLGRVVAEPIERHALLAYDEEWAVTYMGDRLRPYWRRPGGFADARALIQAAENDYDKIMKACDAFDRELTADLEKVGGRAYADLAILAHRQGMAAHGIAAGSDGRPLMFSKENFSNGCMGTVDVLYPAAPQFLLLSPALLEAQLRPILDYARSDRWRFPFAPHDIGQYPLGNGQVYGGGEKNERNQMPVEETGNLLILMAAQAKATGSPALSREYWPLLLRWAEYLREKGLDPENQLCTDDFAGHLAHNTNLSLKAILAIRAVADLAARLGHDDEAKIYGEAARKMALEWTRMADDGGSHYRLAFDKPGTWSQKYNLVWDKVLGYNLFPAEIARKEIAFYLTKQNTYGLPLDNRADYTKLDWIVWTATMADNRDDFDAIIGPARRYARETPSRVPLSDWYWTTDAKQRGFQARSVVGGLFMPMLAHEDIWQKWARKDSAGTTPHP
jgi:hypothetical protein